MDAFIFNADLLCNDCGQAKRDALNLEAIKAYAVDHAIADVDAYAYGDKAVWIRQHPRTLAKALGFDPDNESEYDSGVYPKGPEGRGGGESDTPAHCATCGVHLENPLTEDGREYVGDKLISWLVYGDGDTDTIREWFTFYRDALDTGEIGDLLLSTLENRLAYVGTREA